MPTFSAKIEHFDRKAGWYYVSVPSELVAPLVQYADRGLIPITAKLLDSSWDTSLLPMGDGTHFIPLPLSIRSAYTVTIDDEIELSFERRQ